MARCIKPRAHLSRRGDPPYGREFEYGNVLLEAVVGLAVGATLGLAMAWGGAQVLHSQRTATAQSMAVFAMRQKLSMASAPAGSASSATSLGVLVGGSTVTLTGVTSCDAPVSIPMTVNGVSRTVQYQKPCTLTTDSTVSNQSVIGGDGVIKF